MPSAAHQPLLRIERRPTTPVSAQVADLLWEPETIFRWLAALTLGGVMLLGGWWSVAGKATYNKQVAGLNIAVAGLILAQLGGLYLLLQGRRAVGIRRLALLGDPASHLPGTAAGTAPVQQVVDLTDAGILVAGEGRDRFHRSTCVLASGRDFQAASREAHSAAGRRPCGVCHP